MQTSNFTKQKNREQLWKAIWVYTNNKKTVTIFAVENHWSLKLISWSETFIFNSFIKQSIFEKYLKDRVGTSTYQIVNIKFHQKIKK